MQGFFYQVTSKTVITAIILVMIEVISPSGKTKKFISFVSGVILIIVIIEPFIGLFKNDYNIKKEYIENKRAVLEYQYSKEEGIDEDNTRYTIMLYRNQIIDNIKDLAKRDKNVKDLEVDLIMNENPSSKDFGRIKRIYLNLKVYNSKETNQEVEIDNIKIDKININENESKNKPYELADSIKKDIAIIFGVDTKNIIISVN